MKLSLLLALVATTIVSVLAQTDYVPTCQLSSLVLTDKNTGLPLSIHDSNGNPFSPGKYRYYCNCNANIDSVTVTINSDDLYTTYDLNFEDATKTQHMQQYLALNQESNQMHFTATPTATPSYANTVVISPACSDCRSTYTVTCYKAPPTTSVSGDPQFVGLRGQSYQVHGVSGEVYSIISDEHLQMNSRFVFLSKGDCPVVNGIKQTNCYAHEGSYLGAIGIKTAAGDKLKLVSGPAKTGFAEVSLNGRPVKIGSSHGFMSFNHSHLVTVTVGNFHMEFDNSDMFINQRVRVLDWATLNAHGLLGQTWRQKTYPNAVKHIEGRVDDYVVHGKDLFGDKFIYNQFGVSAPAATEEEASSEETAVAAVEPEVELQQPTAPAPTAVSVRSSLIASRRAKKILSDPLP